MYEITMASGTRYRTRDPLDSRQVETPTGEIDMIPVVDNHGVERLVHLNRAQVESIATRLDAAEQTGALRAVPSVIVSIDGREVARTVARETMRAQARGSARTLRPAPSDLRGAAEPCPAAA